MVAGAGQRALLLCLVRVLRVLCLVLGLTCLVCWRLLVLECGLCLCLSGVAVLEGGSLGLGLSLRLCWCWLCWC